MPRKCILCNRTIKANGGRKACATCRFNERKTPEYQAKQKLWQTVTLAIRNGTLPRQPCEVCGADRVDAHHDDYSKPLSIRWLCRTHHRQHHEREWRALNAA